MFTKAFESIESSADIQERILNTAPAKLFTRGVAAGAAIATGALGLTAAGTHLMYQSIWYIPVLVAVAFGLALLLKIKVGENLFTNMALMLPIATLRGGCALRKFVRVMLLSMSANFLGATVVACAIFYLGVFKDESLIEAIASRKVHASFVSLFGQAVLCSWALTMAAWSWFRFPTWRARLGTCAAALFFFLCSGYEHAIANLGFLVLANLLPHADGVSWGGLVYNLVAVSLGNIVSGLLVSVGGYYTLRASMARASASLTLVHEDPVPAPTVP